MKCYFEVTPPVFHIDAYRLEGQNIELGLEEFIEGDGVTFIEWPQYIEPLWPDEYLTITLLHAGEDTREISVESNSPRLDKIVEAVKEAF